MIRKKEEIYSGKDGMKYIRTDAGGIALTDGIQRLYGGNIGGLESQYAAATGVEGDMMPSSLVEQYSSALKSAEAAKTNAALEALASAADQSDAEYDAAAKQLYAQKTLGEKAMANSLSSAGLYNSGYSDSARIALENSYASNLAQSENARRASAEKYRLEGIELMSELAAENAKTDALAAQLALQQMNADRDFAFEAQKYADSRADAEKALAFETQKYADSRADAEKALALEAQKYADSRADAEKEYALRLQKYNDEKLEALYNRELAEKKYADTRADIEFERAQMLENAENQKLQQDIKNAYSAAEMGDFSLLEALGIDTSAAKAAYDAELELLVLRLDEARKNAAEAAKPVGGSSSGSGGSAVSSGKNNTGSSSSSAKEDKNKTSSSGQGTFEEELATDLAKRLVSNMKAQNKSYSEVLDYINSIRGGVIKQHGQDFWEKYVEVIAQNYPGGSGYSEPEHLSSMESVMAFIKDSKNSARFFTDSGYNLNAIRELINNADLSDAERRELRTYYGIATSSNSGKIGRM
ncbi:MAG: hypothetical protein IKM29_03010 [Clostridia bacterium]|nr:hypothetical protein [Clostridia bacterium]